MIVAITTTTAIYWAPAKHSIWYFISIISKPRDNAIEEGLRIPILNLRKLRLKETSNFSKSYSQKADTRTRFACVQSPSGFQGTTMPLPINNPPLLPPRHSKHRLAFMCRKLLWSQEQDGPAWIQSNRVPHSQPTYPRMIQILLFIWVLPFSHSTLRT